MKKSEIKVGGLYLAKVSGQLTTVRVDAIRERERAGSLTDKNGRIKPGITVYDVTNLRTGRKTMFRSAAKFRCEDLAPCQEATAATSEKASEEPRPIDPSPTSAPSAPSLGATATTEDEQSADPTSGPATGGAAEATTHSMEGEQGSDPIGARRDTGGPEAPAASPPRSPWPAAAPFPTGSPGTRRPTSSAPSSRPSSRC